MKSILPFALLAGGLLLASSGKKSSSTGSSKKKFPSGCTTEAAKQNYEAVLEYYSKDPIKILSLNELMADLTEKLKDEIYLNKDQYIVHIKPLYANEAYLMARELLAQKGKAALNPKDADPITQEILQGIASDVMWNEGLTPYEFCTPFTWVWKAVNSIVLIASKNLLELGVIKE